MKNSIFKNKGIKSFLDFFSRVAISAIFISAIPGKINGFNNTVEYISSKGIPEPISSILLVGAIICLILGSGFFIFGENQKIWFDFFVTFSHSNNNNFSFIPLPSKSSAYESRIDGWINNYGIKRTNINSLIKKLSIFFIFSTNSGRSFIR